MEIAFFLIIVFIMVVLFSVIFYIIDSLLKKSFRPNEEYLLEIPKLKFSYIKKMIESVIILVILVVKSKVVKITALSIFVVLETVYFLFQLKYLKSKDESTNTIKYFILKTLFSIIVVVLAVTAFYYKIVS